ncbi:hypothetical protein UCRPC4_g05275 [Phaeomoniella chlamydospora]|uniref:Uncharacterized protein n=1 Tax=Phaeomoniella chlamydospora TaxID=158046 RepID=A0A0G2E6U3_PHACM|nr:hypothetical protein UCRPC4_g05275 [Phaeomoniella chlamydospora]
MANYDDYDYDSRPSRRPKLRYPDEDSGDDLRAPPRRSSKLDDHTYRKDPKAAKYGARDHGDPRDIEPRGSSSENRKEHKLRSAGGKGGLSSRRDDFGDDEDEDYVKIPKRSSPKRYSDDDDFRAADGRYPSKSKSYSRGKGKDDFDDEPPRKNETRKRDTRDTYGLDDDDDGIVPIRRSKSHQAPREKDPYDDIAPVRTSSYRKPRGYNEDDYDDDPAPPRRSRTHHYGDDRDDSTRDKGYRSDGREMRSTKSRGAKYDYNYDDRERDRPRYSDRERQRERGYYGDTGGRDTARRAKDYDYKDYDDYDKPSHRSAGRGYRSLDDAPSSRSSRKYRDSDRDDPYSYGSGGRRARDRDRDRSRSRDRYSKSRSRKSNGLKLDMDSLGRYYEQGQRHYKTFKPLVDGVAKLYLDSKKT